MEDQLDESQLAVQLTTPPTANAVSDSLEAWHIFLLLLSLGRPASLVELASKCTLFRATPELIQFLCEIPESPLHLTRNCSITISSNLWNKIVKFVSSDDLNFTFSRGLGLNLGLTKPSRVCGAENTWRTYSRKRKRIRSESECLPPLKAFFGNFHEGKENRAVLRFLGGKESASAQAFIFDGSSNRHFDIWLSDPSRDRFLSSRLETVAHEKEKDSDMCINAKRLICACDMDYERDLYYSKAIKVERALNSSFHQDPFRVYTLTAPVLSTEAEVVDNNLSSRINLTATSLLEAEQKVMPDTQIDACKGVIGDGNMEEERDLEPVVDNDRFGRHFDKLSIDATQSDRLRQENEEEKITMNTVNTLTSLYEEKSKTPLKSSPMIAAFSISQKHLGKLPSKSENGQKESLDRKTQAKTLDMDKVINPLVDQHQSKRRKNPISIKQKSIYDATNNSKEKRNQPEQKEFPCFDYYIVEEEEGSGGYGIVYRARRRSDGLRFAIKCPHINANRHHVQNEVKMLERFGGKNFVIKYEGSFKSGNSDCLVLEHVEHDRPEVLKKEIDDFQLRWYGFCMFKALAGLHKQGVVHRDVKPGNFLFSREFNKGYLIDFNLAMDLHKKYGITDKTKSGHDFSSIHVPLPNTKSLPPARNKRFPTARALDVINQEAGKISKSVLFPKILKRKTDQAKDHANISKRNVVKSQGADGSGITSTKDATSTKTPSAERLREPIPCRGRKELLSLVQEALQGTGHEAQNVPASKRKRVAAPPGNGDRNFAHLSPMPLCSTGIPIAGAGLLKNRGDSNHKREGPCAGTKGFRAPEVLFRSLHQGPKVDVWSAGVTLLYMIMGRTPFGGDPDQNIKEIVRLRGSEDLWEVAKLHNRESSFPTDLFDIKYLPSVRLREWCKVNTRRPEFFANIPASLFDLIDKCLTANPRSRISADEALRHEFFALCHDHVRKHRLSRQGVSLDTETILLSGKQTQTCA